MFVFVCFCMQADNQTKACAEEILSFNLCTSTGFFLLFLIEGLKRRSGAWLSSA